MSDILSKFIGPLLKSSIMMTDIDKLSPSQALTDYQVLSLLEDALKERKTLLKPVIAALAERDGKKTETGSYVADIDGARVEHQYKTAGEPDREEMLALLATRKIESKEVYDEIKALVYNPSKTKHLIELGKLSRAEVDDLCKKTKAVVVRKSEEIKMAFSSAIAPVVRLPQKRKKVE